MPAHSARAQSTQLIIQEGRWERLHAEVEGVEEPVVFGAEEDPEQGPCLVVGPWLAGDRRVGFQYAEPLPLTRGTVRGVYRTEGIRPSGVVVSVAFYRDETYLAAKSLHLGPAEDWTPFEFTIRVPARTADSTVPAFGLGGKMEGRVWFARLQVSAEVIPFTVEAEQRQPRRAAPPTDFEAAGFYRLAERDGSWWLVTPEGAGFYSAGTDGPWFRGKDDWRKAGLESAEFLYRTGFNSLAGWTDIFRWGELNEMLIARGKPPFAMFSAIKTATHGDHFDTLVDADGRDTGWDHDFPDPFDPRFEQWYRARAQQRAEAVRGKPWFVGWFADNEAGHKQLYRHVYSPHCAQALKAFLSRRHSGIAALNRAWGTGFSSFDDLIAKKPDPAVRRGAMYEDYKRFEREIVRRYIEVTISAWRDADPNHLIVSNRFMLDDVHGWLDVLDLYAAYDAIAVNLYPANQRPGLREDEKAIYRLAHEKTGLPVIVGEWSVPAADSGYYRNPEKLDWSFNELLETQQQRALQASQVSLDFFNMPFVVGSHWFIWMDVVNEQREANRGLFAPDGRPWREVADALAEVHHRMGVALR